VAKAQEQSREREQEPVVDTSNSAAKGFWANIKYAFTGQTEESQQGTPREETKEEPSVLGRLQELFMGRQTDTPPPEEDNRGVLERLQDILTGRHPEESRGREESDRTQSRAEEPHQDHGRTVEEHTQHHTQHNDNHHHQTWQERHANENNSHNDHDHGSSGYSRD
jgi:hypothetical protein